MRKIVSSYCTDRAKGYIYIRICIYYIYFANERNVFRFHVPICNYYYVQREADTYHIFIYVERENVPVSRQIKICRVDAVDIRGNECVCMFFFLTF